MTIFQSNFVERKDWLNVTKRKRPSTFGSGSNCCSIFRFPGENQGYEERQKLRLRSDCEAKIDDEVRKLSILLKNME